MRRGSVKISISLCLILFATPTFGDQSQCVRGILSHVLPPENQRVSVYRALYKEFGDQKLLEQYYDNNHFALGALEKLKSLCRGCEELIADPGLILRFEDFTTFWNNHGPFQDPWAAREAFRQHLGSVTLYRALAITEQEARLMLREGLRPQRMIEPKDIITYLNLPEDEPRWKFLNDLAAAKPWGHYQSNAIDELRRTGLVKILRRRVARNGDDTFTQSLTNYPEVGYSVAEKLVRKTKNVAKKTGHVSPPATYLFEINVPVLDLIHFESGIIDFPAVNGGYLGGRSLVIDVRKASEPEGAYGRRVFQAAMDERVESFVFFNIPPNQIKSVQKVESNGLDGFEWMIGVDWRRTLKDQDLSWFKERFKLVPLGK